MKFPTLMTALLDLLAALEGKGVDLIIGGGFGLYLRTESVRTKKERTMFKQWPEARSTNDIDVFLRPDLLIYSHKLQPLADALRELGYSAVTGAEKYQFMRPGTEGAGTGAMKIDLLTGPQEMFQDSDARVDDRRIRPRPSIGIHAHPLRESLTLEEYRQPTQIQGLLSTGQSFSATVFLPHAYTFLLLKLFAFRDRMKDAEKDFGRHHALDLYAIIASTTVAEWEEGKLLASRYVDHAVIQEAGGIVSELFSSRDARGILRMMESPYFNHDLELDSFIDAINELFPAI